MTTFAEAFANSCVEAAEWREAKAAEEDDVRNIHCAEALRTAASWAQSTEDAEDHLHQMLPDVTQTAGLLLLGHTAQRILAAYCFETPEDLDHWLTRVSQAQYQEAYSQQQEQLTGDGT